MGRQSPHSKRRDKTIYLSWCAVGVSVVLIARRRAKESAIDIFDRGRPP
jgi:hypothetical protein